MNSDFSEFNVILSRALIWCLKTLSQALIWCLKTKVNIKKSAFYILYDINAYDLLCNIK